MAQYLSTAGIDPPFTRNLIQDGQSLDGQHSRPQRPLIHILDDYSLLNIFSLCRPVILDESEVDSSQFLEGGEWNRERWWYRLVQVCRRWRYIVLESASHLHLSLVCARGTPVADMLAHFPSLPLIINHLNESLEITAEDQDGIALALQHHRDRVRRIRLRKSIPILQKLIGALDGEFPILEHLLIVHSRYRSFAAEHNMSLNLPKTFRAPHLRHFLLVASAHPIGSPVLTTIMGTGNLVTLSLILIPPSGYFHPNALLQRLPLLPQLETLVVGFNTYHPSREIERQLLRAPVTIHVTLPNLRWLGFRGASAYLEALLPRLTVPLLEKMEVYFFNQLTYSIPHLQQFMSTAGNLRLNAATFTFRDGYLYVAAYPYKGARMFALSMRLGGRDLDWQVASAAQVFHMLKTKFSSVEDLTLQYDRDFTISSDWNNEADRTEWRKFLGSFSNVKTLFMDGELVGQLSRALQPGEGELPTELLPNLRELSYSAKDSPLNSFTAFMDARQREGCPVTMIHP